VADELASASLCPSVNNISDGLDEPSAIQENKKTGRAASMRGVVMFQRISMVQLKKFD